MEASECASKHQRHQQDAGSECEHVRGFAQLKAADATDEQICDDKIEQAPENVDRRGGQALARGCRKSVNTASSLTIEAMEAGMGRQLAVALYVMAMVAVIVGLDFAFFRNRFWPRLIANIGVVLVFAAFYLRFLRRP